MKRILKKALNIGSLSILTDTRLLYRILEDIAPEDREICLWLKKNYDSDSLKSIYTKSCQDPEFLDTCLDRIEKEYNFTKELNPEARGETRIRLIEHDQYTTCDKCGSRWIAGTEVADRIDGCPFCKAFSNSIIKESESDRKKAVTVYADDSGGVSAVDHPAIACTERCLDGSVIEGSKINGIWEGEFKRIYPDGSYRKGTFVCGEMKGEMLYVDSNGNATNGIWEKGNWNGRCRKVNSDKSVTDGFRVNGIWQGKYTKTYPDGSYWSGTNVQDKPTGELTYVDSEGNRMEGIWEYGNWNGKCIRTNKDRSVINGTCINGVWQGAFTKTFDNGSSYKGTYVNGEIEGNLIYDYGDGTSFSGDWNNGSWNGLCTYRSEKGTLFETWINGKGTGRGTYNYNNGQVYEGEIDHFLRHGKGTITLYKTGITIRATFRYDKIVGDVSVHFPNGDLYEGGWNQKPDGKGHFISHKCPLIKSIVYEGKWANGLISGDYGSLTINPHYGPSMAYRGAFDNGKVQGIGRLYSIDSHGKNEIKDYGRWVDNRIDHKQKSKTINTAEIMIDRATNYIRATIDQIPEIIS